VLFGQNIQLLEKRLCVRFTNKIHTNHCQLNRKKTYFSPELHHLPNNKIPGHRLRFLAVICHAPQFVRSFIATSSVFQVFIFENSVAMKRIVYSIQ